MTELTLEEVKEFFSKTDFDFSTVAGWNEFKNERAIYGKGRDADGYHARDFTNYNVHTAQYFLRSSVTATIMVRPFAGSLSTPPGNLYVLYPNASWQDEVKSFFIGTGFGTQYFNLTIGGPTPNGEEYWGHIYFIALSSSERVKTVPGLKQATKILKSVGRGMAAMGVGYYLGAKIGNGPITWHGSMPQRVFAPNISE